MEIHRSNVDTFSGHGNRILFKGKLYFLMDQWKSMAISSVTGHWKKANR